MEFAIATNKNQVEVIKVTEKKCLVHTNIYYSIGEIRSICNIDRTSIALCKDYGIEIYNKKYKKK